nr:unnamed protein product [Callosobruchus analis]
MDHEVDNEQQIPTEDEASEDAEDLVPRKNSNFQSEHTTNQTLSRETVAQHPKCVSNIKKRKLEATSDPRIDQAFTILQKSTERDACEIYGEHVAMKLRSYSKRTQIMVQHLFNNILFNADMGQYDNINANYNDANPFPRSTVSSPYPSPYSNISSTKSHSRTSTPFSPAPSPIPVVHHNINVNSNDSYQRSTVAPPYPPPYSNLSSNQSHHSRTSTPLSQPTSPIPVVHHKINTNYDDTDPHQLSIAISTVTSPDPSPNSGVLSTKSCPTPLSQPLTSVSVKTGQPEASVLYCEEKELSGPSEAYDSVEKLSEVVGEEIIIEVINVPAPSSGIEDVLKRQDETTQSNNVVVEEYIETSNSKCKGHEEDNGSSEETNEHEEENDQGRPNDILNLRKRSKKHDVDISSWKRNMNKVKREKD